MQTSPMIFVLEMQKRVATNSAAHQEYQYFS